jgi:hypothetical protein
MSLEDQLTELFYRHDPVGLAELGAPEDEYWPEARALLPILNGATSQEHLTQIVHSVFLKQFEVEETCGPESAYDAIAHEIWMRFLVNQQVRPS